MRDKQGETETVVDSQNCMFPVYPFIRPPLVARLLYIILCSTCMLPFVLSIC